MEQIKKYTDFLLDKTSVLPFHRVSEDVMYMFRWIAGRGEDGSYYQYIKSCQYSENLVNELRMENNELKSLVYNMLDEINELKQVLSQPVQVLSQSDRNEMRNKLFSVAELRGEIKRNGVVANAVKNFKKNYFQERESIRQQEIIEGWQN